MTPSKDTRWPRSPVVLVRAVERALREMRAVAARYWSPAVAAWQAEALRELGALLFTHAGAVVELEVAIVDRSLAVARRNGFA